MPPVPETVDAEYDFIVLGGGSGGFGASVCLVSLCSSIFVCIDAMIPPSLSDALETMERKLL